jgi:N-acetylmuramoyl-L-alanine amidase
LKKNIIFKITIYLLLTLFFVSNLPVSAADRYFYDEKWHVHTHAGVSLYIDDTKLEYDVPPLLIGDRTLVPVRFLFEKLGAAVLWDESSRQVRISTDKFDLILNIDNTKATLSGKTVEMDVPAKIITDINNTARTFVPARFVSEKLGYEVLWSEKSARVTICTDNKNIPEAKITSIKNYKEGNSDIVEIETTANLKPSVSMLSSPNRMIFDFPNAMLAMDGGATAITGRSISNVRYAYHQGLYSRVVMDLISTPQYTTSYNNGIFKIVLNNSVLEDIEYEGAQNYIKINNAGAVSLSVSDEANYIYTFTVSSSSIGEGSLQIDDSYIKSITTQKTNNNLLLTVSAKSKLNFTIEKTGSSTRISFMRDTLKNVDIDTLKDPAKAKIVVIDPGHGGSDPGTVGKVGDAIDLYEKEVNLDVSLKVYDILKAAGASVYMTRNTDVFVGLTERADFANNLNAALFVSIHHNSFTSPEVKGSMVFYYASPGGNPAGKTLAGNIQKELVSSLNTKDRGIADGSRYVVINKSNMPAVIVEGAFVSNPEEKALLKTQEFRQQMANAIANGIIKTLNGM